LIGATSFSNFAGLLVAAGKLSADPAILNGRQALADLAADPGALAAALRDTGLTPLAREIAPRPRRRHRRLLAGRPRRPRRR
jgi:hypothetical protein